MIVPGCLVAIVSESDLRAGETCRLRRLMNMEVLVTGSAGAIGSEGGCAVSAPFEVPVHRRCS